MVRLEQLAPFPHDLVMKVRTGSGTPRALLSLLFHSCRSCIMTQGHASCWAQVVSPYGSAELVWCQEEPKNMGAFRYVQPRLATAMRELSMAAFGVPPRALHYVGRPAAASAGARYTLPRLGTLASVPRHAVLRPRA